MRAHAKRSQDNASADPTSPALEWRQCKPGKCSLQLPETLSEADWKIVGATLGSIETSSSWWIGDWWVHGEARYGTRKATVQGDEWNGPSFETCMNCGIVARRFETSRRREVLSFSHHSEVASLHELDADALLDWAEETIATAGRPRSVRALRAEQWYRYHHPHGEDEDSVEEETLAIRSHEAATATTWPSPIVLKVVEAPDPPQEIARGEAPSDEHSVHWLTPPSERGDQAAITMVLDVVRRILTSMSISERLRQRLTQFQAFLEASIE